MPKDFVTCNLIMCERLLAEADGVLSVIRMVDLFQVDPSVVGPDTQATIQVQILLTARFSVGAMLEHTVEFKLARPDEDPVSVGGVRPVKVDVKFPEVPTGFSMVVNTGIRLKKLGNHYLFAYIDGDEVAKLVFTLRTPQASKAE